jgi:hypothetical protein
MSEPPFEPGQPDQPAFHGYGTAPIPDRRDDVVDRYVARLRDGGPPAVAAAIDEVSELGASVLRVYGERAAARAVRERSVELLVAGMVAVVVGGLHRNDRDSFLPMALLDDAATRVGATPRQVVDAAAAIVGNPGDINLMLWLGRAPQDRTPESMGFAATDGPEGFRYTWS